jgi:hypothetical protein
MTITRTTLTAFAAISLLALAGCGEEQVVVDSSPDPEEPVVQDRAAPADEADTLERLRESAEDLAAGAERMAGEARQRAERALEDAGPLIEQAGEIAGRIGESVDEIVRQAGDDLQRAAEMLEERIAEMSGERVVVEDTDALLSPEDQLNADTRAAARAVQAGIEPAYVGVWADTAGNCGRIDQDYVERFAVITPTTIRHVETLCNFEAQPLEGGSATVPAACIAEGDEEQRMITFSMPSAEELRISHAPEHEGSLFVRCHLPG